MAFIAPTFEQSKAFMQGDDTAIPELSVSSAPSAIGSLGGSGVTDSTLAPPPQPSQALSSSNPAISSQGEGDLRTRLFSPIEQGLETGRGGLNSALSSFDTQAGAGRTFQSIGGQGILDQALMPGANLSQAQSLVNAQYGGPQGLDYTAPQDLQTRAQALQGGGALQGLIQTLVPGLSPGFARFEAQNLTSDPSFRQDAGTYGRQIDEFMRDLAKARETSRMRAQERTTQERDIRSQSRQYLGEQREGTLDQLAQRADDETARRQQLESLFSTFMEQPTQQSAEALGAGDPFMQAFGTSQQPQQAAGVFQDITSSFSDIQNVPLMRLGVDGRGNEQRQVEIGGILYNAQKAKNGDPFPAHGESPSNYRLPPGMSKEEFTRIAQRAWERQRQLEQRFAPAGAELIGRPDQDPKYFTPDVMQQHGTQRQPGDLSTLLPLYLGEGLGATEQLPDIRDFVSFDPGMAPNVGNVATSDEREKLNRIAELLGDPVRFSEMDPFEQARIIADSDSFLTAHENAMGSRKEGLDRETEAWRRDLAAARHAYKKAKRASNFGDVLSVASLALPALSFVAPALLPGSPLGFGSVKV